MNEKYLSVALQSARLASNKILEIYQNNSTVVTMKEDSSPVTQADILANEVIIKTILENFPTHGILSEELVDNKERFEKEFVWIIDPLDGTKDFIAQDDEFTVNIALVHNGRPIVGVIAIPVTKEIYYASLNEGSYYFDGMFTSKIEVSQKRNNYTALISRFHVSDADVKYLTKVADKISVVRKIGSSIKSCYVAHGKAEINVKCGGGSKEWDIAASDLIVNEAKGFFGLPNGDRILYNKNDVTNHQGFVALHRLDQEFLKGGE